MLAGFKLAAGYGFASAALVADGFNNLTDIIASTAVLIGLRISQKPPDEDHPYGHFRAETIAALVASFIMATVGIQVLVTTVEILICRGAACSGLFSAWIALAAGAAMLLVYLYNRRTRQKD